MKSTKTRNPKLLQLIGTKNTLTSNLNAIVANLVAYPKRVHMCVSLKDLQKARTYVVDKIRGLTSNRTIQV